MPDDRREIKRVREAFKPKTSETFATAGDERENRAVGDQIHDGQDQKRFHDSGFLQIGLAKARLAPVRDEVKSGRPAEYGEKGFRIQIDKIRDDQNEKRNRREKIRRERDP